MQRVADHVDHFTSKSTRIMAKRKKQSKRGTNNDAHWYRLRIITQANAALTLVPLITDLPTESDDMVLQVRSKTWRRRHPQHLLQRANFCNSATAPAHGAHTGKTCRTCRAGFKSVNTLHRHLADSPGHSDGLGHTANGDDRQLLAEAATPLPLPTLTDDNDNIPT